MRKYALFLLILLSGFGGIKAQVTIKGYVIDFENAQPIEGATIFIHDKYNISFNPRIQTTTDEKGYFEFPDMEYGEYSVNAFVYFEYQGDSIAYVYQPGIFNVKDSLNTHFKDKGFPVNFGFSTSYMIQQYEFHNIMDSISLFDSTSVAAAMKPYNDPLINVISQFLRPRVLAPEPNFIRTSTSFFQKKDW